MEDPEGHRGVEFLVGLGHLVEEHAPRGHGLLAALQVAVQRHEDGAVAAAGQQFEAGDRWPLVVRTLRRGNHVRPALDLDVARHAEPPAADRGVGQAETQGLLGGVHFQRGDHVQRQPVPAWAGDQQVQPSVGCVADGRRLVVELRRQQAHAAEVQGNRVQAVFQHVDRDRAVEPGTALVDRDVVVGRDGHGGMRNVRLGGLFGLLDQGIIFLPRQEHAMRPALQQDFQVGDRNVDLAGFGRRFVRGRSRPRHGGGPQGQRRRSAAAIIRSAAIYRRFCFISDGHFGSRVGFR